MALIATTALALLVAAIVMVIGWPSGRGWRSDVLVTVLASASAYLVLAAPRTVDAVRGLLGDRLDGNGITTAARAIGLGMLVMALASVLVEQTPRLALEHAVAWGVVALCSVELARLGQTRLFRNWVMAGLLTRRVALVGSNAEVEPLVDGLRAAGSDRQVLAGVFDDGAFGRSRLPELLDATRRGEVDQIVVAIPATQPQRLHAALAALRSVVVELHVVSEVTRIGLKAAGFGLAGDHQTLAVQRPALDHWASVQKAVFDRTLALLLLLTLSPVLIATAIAIRLDSPGPILFRQPRVGYDNRIFQILKFRSMHAAMGDLLASRQTSRSDPRVTSVGRVIRKYSVDELPQIINVLLGDMSLVGPRPHALNTRAEGLALHEAETSYAVRHRVRPGITGWAQVNGLRGELRTVDQVRGRVAHDLHYIENWSLGLDLRILWLTLANELFSKSAF